MAGGSEQFHHFLDGFLLFSKLALMIVGPIAIVAKLVAAKFVLRLPWNSSWILSAYSMIGALLAGLAAIAVFTATEAFSPRPVFAWGTVFTRPEIATTVALAVFALVAEIPAWSRFRILRRKSTAAHHDIRQEVMAGVLSLIWVPVALLFMIGFDGALLVHYCGYPATVSAQVDYDACVDAPRRYIVGHPRQFAPIL